METSLVILNRNDVAGAKVVLPQIDRSLFSEIFIVDGGSTDGSQALFEELNLKYYSLDQGGRGGAMRFAIEKAKGTHIIFFSTDGEEDPATLTKIIDQFEAGADMVIASRLAPGGKHKAQEKFYWIHRMLYLKFFTFLLNLSFKSSLHDCWNGYRGFKLETLKSIPTDAKDFMIEAQQTMRFLKANKKVVEVPTHEGQRIGGKSGNPIFKSGILHIFMLFKEKFIVK